MTNIQTHIPHTPLVQLWIGSAVCGSCPSSVVVTLRSGQLLLEPWSSSGSKAWHVNIKMLHKSLVNPLLFIFFYKKQQHKYAQSEQGWGILCMRHISCEIHRSHLVLFNKACTGAGAGQNCDLLVGHLAVYRVCFAMAAFYFLFMLIMIRVDSTKDCRAGIQNGQVT